MTRKVVLRVRQSAQANVRAATARVEETRERDRVDVAIDNGLQTGQTDMAEAFPDPATDPGGRLKALGGSEYHKEYRLKMIHRMLMRNLSADMIAQQMGISVPTVYRLRRELLDRLRWEAQRINSYEHFGRTMSFYDEVRGMALKIATDTKIAAGPRVGALSVAIGAEESKHKFLQLAGFYDHNRFTPVSSGEGDSVEKGRDQLGLILDMSSKILNGDDTDIFSMDANSAADLQEDEDMQLL